MGIVLLALAARNVRAPDAASDDELVLLSEDLDALGVLDELPLPGERFADAFADDDVPLVDTLFDDSPGDVAL